MSISQCILFIVPFLLLFPSQVFCNKNKTVLSKGDILKFPKLAETMEIIAKQGANAFYTGKIGHDLIQDIKAAGWCNFIIGRASWGCILE